MLGLSALCHLPLAEMPQGVSRQFHQILMEIVRTLKCHMDNALGTLVGIHSPAGCGLLMNCRVYSLMLLECMPPVWQRGSMTRRRQMRIAGPHLPVVLQLTMTTMMMMMMTMTRR